MKINRAEREKPLFHWFKRFAYKNTSEDFQANQQTASTTAIETDADSFAAVDADEVESEPPVSPDSLHGKTCRNPENAERSGPGNGVQAAFASPFDYSPQAVIDSIQGVGNPDIHRELQTIFPVYWQMPMPDLLAVFSQYPQYTFFPVVDDHIHPKGIIREQRLKQFVYSRFGSTLLENPNLKDKLSDFIEPCMIVDIHDKNEAILQTYSESGTTEGVIVTSDSKYLGVISLRSLVKLGHERELSLQESHNRILQQRNNDINNILQNMKQGIFTVQENGTIHHDYSAYLETILETREIEGKNYFDLLFRNSNLSKDKLSQTKSTIENSLGEDVLTFEVNSHLLVDEYQLRLDDDRVKHIELFWNPIVDENDLIRRFVVNIRDKTEIVTLQEMAIQQQKEFQMITQVFSITHDTFETFIDSSREYVRSCVELLSQNEEFRSDIIDHVFRNLHTIKGNSRLYGFDDLSNVVHEVEEVVNRVRSQKIAYHSEQLTEEIKKVDATLQEYSAVVQKKLGGFLENKQKGVFMDDQLFSALRNTIMSENCDQLLDSVQTIVKSKQILEALETIPLTTIFRDINASLTSMAEIVGKAKPNIYVNNNKIRVTQNISSTLNIVILHSIRNSLSHGIEDEETRKKLGKSEKGNIYLVAGVTDERFYIEYRDDGAGLDLDKIMQKARNVGLIKVDKPLGARQIAELIFCPGLSTAKRVTEIAGRGVGMDAIMKAMKSIGGKIDIIFLDTKKRVANKRPFKFVFELPVDYAQVLD